MTTITTMESPIGPLTVGATDRGIRFVMWHDDQRRPPDDGDAGRAADAILAAGCAQLAEYFRGERTEFDLPLDPVGTPFQHTAWAALRTIDYGSTVSYGEQARRMGDARKARAVGAANGRNPIGIIVPCHRVVGADGSLTGFAGGLSSKAWLLDHERQVLAGA
ncbi:MAG: methylated-DNA--[protein]-cysteine S-methyltransferase [Ilumatobacteraceae bacterium]